MTLPRLELQRTAPDPLQDAVRRWSDTLRDRVLLRWEFLPMSDGRGDLVVGRVLPYAPASNMRLTLPRDAVIGDYCAAVRESSSSTAVSVRTLDGSTINGAATLSLSTARQWSTFIRGPRGWYAY